MPKQYTIGEDSRHFLDALDAFAAFENKFIDALTHVYGDQQADGMFEEHRETFEAVELVIMDYLRIQFTQGMGGGSDAITI